MATSLWALHFLCLSWVGKVVTQTSGSDFSARWDSASSRNAAESVTPTAVSGATEFDYTASTASFLHSTTESVSIATATPHVTSAAATTQPRIIPTDTTATPAGNGPDCPCDVTSRFCDIGCCCDVIDCNIADLSSVFTGCETEQRYGVCVESWLMFRGNVDPALITVNESVFCVRPQGDPTEQQVLPVLPVLPYLPKVQDSYSFSAQALQSSSPADRGFYMVDDVILSYYSGLSVIGVLRQPSRGTSTSLCVERNPARFLRSGSLSCSRLLTRQSCLSDPGFSARSYFSELSLLKAPVPQNVSIPGFTITVLPLAEWPEPHLENGSCFNVVSKVEYTVRYTSGGLVTKVTVNVTLTDSDVDVQLLQQHAVRYQLATPSPTPASTPAVGLKLGAPVTGRFNNKIEPLTVQGVPQGGDCLNTPHARVPLLFGQNYITGCTFRAIPKNCSELQSQLSGVLQGVSTPDVVAMSAGSRPEWTRVITQDCISVPTEGLCQSGCVVPVSLSIQILWAKRGRLSLPQNYILGAKFLFSCRNVKCPLIAPVAVTTEVTFSEATVYPAPPRGQPQPHWKFPFGFFSRGADERDSGPVLNCCACSKALWGSTAWLLGFILSVIV
ncbi:tectonic-3-like isoform X1 [Scleropages formosus]|nr:tectonic-3-like isoform X1 [Scleropages formosus]